MDNIEIETIVRDMNEYHAKEYGAGEVTQGYFALGHYHRQCFLATVLRQTFNLVVCPERHSWWERVMIEKKPVIHPEYGAPRAPTAADVRIVYWRNWQKHPMNAKPETRGSYPVTYLPVEGSAGNPQYLEFLFVKQGKKWILSGDKTFVLNAENDILSHIEGKCCALCVVK